MTPPPLSGPHGLLHALWRNAERACGFPPDVTQNRVTLSLIRLRSRSQERSRRNALLNIPPAEIRPALNKSHTTQRALAQTGQQLSGDRRPCYQ